MEVAIIQWKTIDSRIVVDDLYEHINAPKWADLDALDAWFCRPGCDHPKKVEDFFSEKERTPFSNSKIQRSASVSDIPLYQRSNRDATLKKRGANQPFGISNHRVIEDAENQEPNFSTLPQHKAKPGKGAITNQARIRNKKAGHERAPKLRSTLSARNLFSGTDLLSKFCNELKKLATRAHDRESAENVGENVVIVNDRGKERKPFAREE